MFEIESVWRIEKRMLILRIIGTVKTNNLMLLDRQIEGQMIHKMVRAILEAEKYNGKALDVAPNLPIIKNQMVICSSIIFDNLEHLEEFKTVCPQILNQE